MNELLQQYKKLRSKLNALSYAMYVISWDSETEAPIGCFEERSNQIGELVSMMLDISHSDEYVGVVKQLFENKESLDIDDKLEIEKVYESLMKELDSRTKYISELTGFEKTVIEGITYLETVIGGE